MGEKSWNYPSILGFCYGLKKWRTTQRGPLKKNSSSLIIFPTPVSATNLQGSYSVLQFAKIDVQVS